MLCASWCAGALETSDTEAYPLHGAPWYFCGSERCRGRGALQIADKQSQGFGWLALVSAMNALQAKGVAEWWERSGLRADPLRKSKAGFTFPTPVRVGSPGEGCPSTFLATWCKRTLPLPQRPPKCTYLHGTALAQCLVSFWSIECMPFLWNLHLKAAPCMVKAWGTLT